MADLLAIGLRALASTAGLQAAGVAFFLSLFEHDLVRSSERIGATATRTALAALALTIAHAVVEPARLTGELSGIFDGALHKVLLSSDSGTALAVRLLGLVLLICGGLRRARSGSVLSLIGATLVVCAFTFAGHTAAEPTRWLLAVLLIAHLLLIAFWLGALWPLLSIARDESPAVTGAVIARFSRLAARLVPGIFVAGVAIATLLLPSFASLGTPYGLLLIAKVGAFALLMGLAAANKWRFGPRLASGDRAAQRAFRRSVRVEWVLIVAVITVTAAMTSLFSPE